MEIRSVNNYDYDENDIAKSLKRAMSQGADPETVRYLNNERNLKIEALGAAGAKYKNDSVSRAAQSYVDSFAKSNTEKLAEARRKTQAEGLRQAYKKAKQTYESGVDESAKTSANARRLYVADAYKKQLDTEEALAKLGLGRGAGNGTTSGFGESAKAMLLSDAAEGLSAIYENERAEKGELARARSEAEKSAEDRYFDAIDKSYEQQAENALSADKNYNDMRLSVMNMSNQRQESDRNFEYEKQQASIKRDDELKQQMFDNAADMFEKTGRVESESQAEILGLPVGTQSQAAKEFAYNISLSEREFETAADEAEFERAYMAFEAAGVVASQEMAEILKIPVGTKLWSYVTDTIRANASMVSAGASARSADASMINANANMAEVGVSNMRAENEAYANKTARLKAYSQWKDDELDRALKTMD